MLHEVHPGYLALRAALQLLKRLSCRFVLHPIVPARRCFPHSMSAVRCDPERAGHRQARPTAVTRTQRSCERRQGPRADCTAFGTGSSLHLLAHPRGSVPAAPRLPDSPGQGLTTQRLTHWARTTTACMHRGRRFAAGRYHVLGRTRALRFMLPRHAVLKQAKSRLVFASSDTAR
jgi:hypothetical protein